MSGVYTHWKVAVLCRLSPGLPGQRLGSGMKVLEQDLMVGRASCSQPGLPLNHPPIQLVGLYSASSSEVHAPEIAGELCSLMPPLLSPPFSPLVLSLCHLFVSHVEVPVEGCHHQVAVIAGPVVVVLTAEIAAQILQLVAQWLLLVLSTAVQSQGCPREEGSYLAPYQPQVDSLCLCWD